MLQKTDSTGTSIAFTLEDNQMKNKFFLSKLFFEFAKRIKTMYFVLTLLT